MRCIALWGELGSAHNVDTGRDETSPESDTAWNIGHREPSREVVKGEGVGGGSGGWGWRGPVLSAIKDRSMKEERPPSIIRAYQIKRHVDRIVIFASSMREEYEI